MPLSLPFMRHSRHPLARVLSLVLGLALLGLLLIFGLLAAGILLVGGSVLLAWRYWTRRQHLARTDAHVATPGNAQRQVPEGEYVVLRREGPATR